MKVKSLLAKFSSILAVILILVANLFITVRFQLITPNFWNTVFDKADMYNKAQVALSYAAQNQIEAKLVEEGVDLESLSVGERAALLAQADMIREVVTTQRLQEFAKENVTRITDYANGKSDKLLLYTPFSEWGIKSSVNGEDKSDLLTSETDVQTLIDQNKNPNINRNSLVYLKNLKGNSETLLTILVAAILVLIIFNYATSTKEIKLISTSNILLYSGAITLFSSMLLKYIGDNLVRSSPYIRDPSKIILGAFIPAFFNEITKMWVLSAIGLIIAGLLLRLIATVKSRRQKTLQARSLPKTQLDIPA